LVLGLASIAVSLVAHDFLEASWLIILSVLLDKLDGTAARALKATSDIGVQLDSFADFVTFGIAPGAMLFAIGSAAHATGTSVLWSGDTGLVVLASLSAMYILCTCIRLAKFNVLAETLSEDASKVFYGMPSTFAGGLIAITLILMHRYGSPEAMEAMPIAAAVLGLLMVSNWPLPKLLVRKSRIINIVQFTVVALTYVFGFARIFPEFMAFSVAGYALIGFIWGFKHRKRLWAARRLDPYPADSAT
jgi:CDP-diacylglycerol--serine O-phosphatidyltransferase